MFNPFDMGDSDDEGTVFRDIIMLALLGFAALLIMILPHINPVRPEDQKFLPPGNLIVHAEWPDSIDVDVDLWVRAPGDRPVGYSNKSGSVFNLLRDDVGLTRDQSNLNYEDAFTRGIPSGEYVVNLHLYRNRSGILPVPVSVRVDLRTEGGSISRLLMKKVELKTVGNETTVYRFSMDEEGRFITSSVHNLPIALRSRKSRN